MELQTSLELLSSTIKRCKDAQKKCKEGTSQHSLLKHRIKALEISKALLEKAKQASNYTLEELHKALPPMESILSKVTKAQSKYPKDHPQYKRYEPMIRATTLAIDHIKEEIKRR